MTKEQADRSTLSLIQLRYFVAAAERESFAEAARDLGVDQPLLWRHVRNLEKRYGIDLFERVGHRVKLSAAGHALLREARAAVLAADSFDGHAEQAAEGNVGLIAIACYPVHITFAFADVIASFIQGHGGIDVDLGRVRDDRRVGRSPFGDLETGEVDLAIGPMKREDFGGLQLWRASYVAIVSDEHPWRTLTEVPASELRGQELLLTPQGHRSRTQVEEACRAAGFEPTVRVDTTNVAALVALGAAGLGIPVIGDDHIPRDGRRPYPVVTGHDGYRLGDDIWMHWRRETPSPAVNMFIQHTVTYLSNNGPELFASLSSHQSS